MNSERPPKIAIPLKRIERLIEMAKRHNLACLEIGHIKIVPAPLPKESGDAPKSRFDQALDAIAKRQQHPLTPRQLEDAMLFGPNGVELDD